MSRLHKAIDNDDVETIKRIMEEGSIHVDAWIQYEVSIVLVNVHSDVILSNYNTANLIIILCDEAID